MAKVKRNENGLDDMGNPKTGQPPDAWPTGAAR
jgi:hypothetical protein